MVQLKLAFSPVVPRTKITQWVRYIRNFFDTNAITRLQQLNQSSVHHARLNSDVAIHVTQHKHSHIDNTNALLSPPVVVLAVGGDAGHGLAEVGLADVEAADAPAIELGAEEEAEDVRARPEHEGQPDGHHRGAEAAVVGLDLIVLDCTCT